MTMHQAKICMGCWQQLHLPVPLRGVLSVPFRAFGIRPSRMNPNTCTICELMFTTVMRARKVTTDATVLFADLRGYTRLSQSLSPDAVSRLLDAFYDECAGAIWEYDGLLNKTSSRVFRSRSSFMRLDRSAEDRSVHSSFVRIKWQMVRSYW
jgi:adenylate cyclase